MTTITGTATFEALQADAISDLDRLREVYALPAETAVRKQMDALTPQTAALIACSSLVLVASADPEGRCDVSPRGGPAGFARSLPFR